jgi:hypothetical protein
MNPSDDSLDHNNDPLTRIRDAYTLSCTPEDTPEVDQVIVSNFLRILAEVAVNIASRGSNNAQSKG